MFPGSTLHHITDPSIGVVELAKTINAFRLSSRELFAIQCKETTVWLSHGQICNKLILILANNWTPCHTHRCSSENHRRSAVLRRPDASRWRIVWQEASEPIPACRDHTNRYNQGGWVAGLAGRRHVS